MWPQFRYNQTDIVALSTTPPFVAREYHPQNELYGFHDLIKDYAGLPRHRALPWVLEHAITFEDPAGYPPDINSRLPIILSVSERQAAVVRAKTAAKVEPIGSSFFYMQRVADPMFARTPAPDRRGTLVFPDKSTVNKTTDFDREAFARRLAELPKEFQPVAVSVPWRDVQRGVFAAFERAGLMLVTSGHPLDPLFLFRHYDLCRHFRYAAANDISTSFCTSVLGGCRFFFLSGGRLTISEHGVTTIYENEPTLQLPAKQACLAASPFPPALDRSAQVRLAEQYAGKAFLREPEFFQAAAEEGYRMLQASPPLSVSSLAITAPDGRAAWLTNGIDVDGWAVNGASLRIPPRAGRWGVRLRLEFPRPSKWQSNLRIDVGKRRHTRLVRSGSWIVEIALPQEERALDVEIALEDESLLDIDDRTRGYRVAQIEWREWRQRRWLERWGLYLGKNRVVVKPD
ncbi:MAG: hypothetical protein WCC69_07445 [Pirellulales bacterium]